MANRFRTSWQSIESGAGEINLSPLIDIVFILLIFFIVTTVFVEETGVEVSKPRAISSQDLERHSILIAITAGSEVYYGGREVGVEGVRALVARLIKQESAPVIIQADKKTPTEITVAVLDEAKLGGAERVFISSVVEP